MQTAPDVYFPFELHLSASARRSLDFERLWEPFGKRSYPPALYFRRLAAAIAVLHPEQYPPVSAAHLNLYATLLTVYRYLFDNCVPSGPVPFYDDALQRAGLDPYGQPVAALCNSFRDYFPPLYAVATVRQRQVVLRELLLVRLAAANPAVRSFHWLMDDAELAAWGGYRESMARLEQAFAAGPLLDGVGVTLIEALYGPIQSAPDSLADQLGYVRDVWGELLPRELFEGVLTAFDLLEEEQRAWGGGGPGPSHVLRFGRQAGAMAGEAGGDLYAGPGHTAGYEQHEYEAFSPDADWMSNVVLLAKMTPVWLDQLSRTYGYPITRLDQIPDAELDRLAARGFTGLWLIGLWERSAASCRIKQLCGNPEAHASAYSLYDYTIAAELGGEQAFHNLRDRAWQRGIRLASDMVPNHTGIYSRWVVEHPDWFIQSDYPPFPTYRFNGEDLSSDARVTIQIEDGYWSRDDAAVVFRLIDRLDGRTRYLYHGNDGTSIPWNDTAQLNYLLPEVREAVIQTILHVARLTPIIRFDAAMTLAKKHYQRLWFPQRGLGGGIPSRGECAMARDEFDALFPVEFWREVVDRVAREVPGTLLLAEAFWMMEGYFVRTLGMHRVYNSAFMNMLKEEENAKYRQTIKNVLEFNHEILKRFVNFMNNPDEKTAVEQFGSQGKYFGACVLMCTMPGLPMFGHGQVEGFHEKYGMEYRRAYWDEPVDQGLLQAHEYWIFPLLKQRWLFSGSEQFALYDFVTESGAVDENVFAYSNRAGAERALILFNNRYGTTSGRLQRAVPVAVGGGGEGAELVSRTLSEALDLPTDARYYVAVEELVSGLVFLRSAAELSQHGIWAELGEYQFQVFHRFRVLEESREQPWGELYLHLSGRGVADLAEAMVRLQHAALIGALQELLSGLEALGQVDPAAREELAGLAHAWAAACGSEAVEETCSLSVAVSLLAAARSRDSWRRILRLMRQNGVRRDELRLLKAQQRELLAIVLVTQLGLPLADEPLERLGLKHPLFAWVVGDEPCDHHWMAYHAQLCGVVALVWQELRRHSGGEGWLSVLQSPLVRRFLAVHEDQGVVWFNKERFDDLLVWLAAVQAYWSVAYGTAELTPFCRMRELAVVAGFRMQRLLALVRDELRDNRLPGDG